MKARQQAAEYFVTSGVRRALVYRQAARKTIPAILYREGEKPRTMRVRLERLHVPATKSTVARDSRFALIEPPIHTPIEIEPLGARSQPRSVPLAAVTLSGKSGSMQRSRRR